MDVAIRLESATIVRARISQFMLGAETTCARLGTITLKPHQQSAVTRAEAALEEFGGALLCDDVGLGKTFVATAIARRFRHRLIVAPAALGAMWRDALQTTETSAELLTFERLSHANGRLLAAAPHDLVIVDEAHHARNTTTRRYERLAKLTRAARVLLLTATPIHNDTGEMIALLSLFLGSRARALTKSELARCIVRREHSDLAHDIAVPAIIRARDKQISDDPAIVSELMSLPPPLPVRDGGVGGALIGRGLVHQWASSEAALREAVRRRIAKAGVLTLSLESGCYPTAGELKTWIYGEGALQLGFPELLSSPITDAFSLLDSVRAHADALHQFSMRHRAKAALDEERAGILREIRAAHPAAKIVAFAQYAETVSMLFRRLSSAGCVAMLGARGGFVAGGMLTREETLVRFAPHAFHARIPSPAERIDLLLTTDLLSEGVNLQDAEVVVHLDVPWTAARMEQRVGRIARMGSRHSRVHVYLIRPPTSAASVLRSETLVQRKWRVAKRTVGSSLSAPFADADETGEVVAPLDSVPARSERLRAILETWRGQRAGSDDSNACVSSVRSRDPGFVAAISAGGRPVMLASISGCVSANLEDQIEACLLCGGSEVPTDPDDCRDALDQIHAWIEHDLASASAGVAGSHSRVQRHILQRIESAIQNAPPHLRTARSQVAARARTIATGEHNAALEAELISLGRSLLPDDEWLEAVAGLKFDNRPEQRTAHPAPALTIHAVLLLQPCQSASLKRVAIGGQPVVCSSTDPPADS